MTASLVEETVALSFTEVSLPSLFAFLTRMPRRASASEEVSRFRLRSVGPPPRIALLHREWLSPPEAGRQCVPVRAAGRLEPLAQDRGVDELDGPRMASPGGKRSFARDFCVS